MTTDQTPDRRERYAAAIRAAGDTAYGNRPFYEAIADAVIALADAEHAELRKRHWDGLRRADAINNSLMEEVQRYAAGEERPVLWSVYNEMHKRALKAEAEVDRLRRMADEAQPGTEAQAPATLARIERLALAFEVSGNEFIAERIRAAVTGVEAQPCTEAWDVPDARPGTTDYTITHRATGAQQDGAPS